MAFWIGGHRSDLQVIGTLRLSEIRFLSQAQREGEKSTVNTAFRKSSSVTMPIMASTVERTGSCIDMAHRVEQRPTSSPIRLLGGLQVGLPLGAPRLHSPEVHWIRLGRGCGRGMGPVLPMPLLPRGKQW